MSPRFFTAFAESTFPVEFFVDGRKDDGQLDMDVARSFFQKNQYPDDFHRANGPKSGNGIDQVFAAHPIQPGANNGTVNSYTPDPSSADFDTFCLLYYNFVNQTIKGLYPNPKGVLRDALNTNLNYFYQGINGNGCTQVFPYGQ